MALFGKLDVLANQAASFDLLHEGIKYLQTVNMEDMFSEVSPGNNKKVEIKGKSLFAIFQEYDSKPLSGLKFEGHKRYIDIQYIYSGEEFIGVAGLDQISEPAEYNDEKDIHLSKVAKYSNWMLLPGEGAIFYPEDMHAPGMAIEQPQRVKKVVVKIAID
ncbi:MAG: YhcH/YjgK/YiaL family protein [Marinilabiliaceae bacterium]|nr:YhcH/YjgK/YiaL family protein [Marinilabiliaceae bacterium]